MSDLNHHDEEEYHFDDSENFDFGEHEDVAEEEFVGEEETVIEDTPNKEWENERPAIASKKDASAMKKKIIMIVGVVVVLGVGYYLMVPHGNNANADETTIPPATPKSQPAAAKQPPAVAVSNMPTASNPSTSTNTTENAPSPALDNTANSVLGIENNMNAAPPSNNMATSTDTMPENAANNMASTAAPSTDITDNSASTATTTGPMNTNTSNPAPMAAAPTSSNTNTASTDNDNSTQMQMQIQTLNAQNQTLALKLQQVTAQSEAAAARATSLAKTVAGLQAQMAKLDRQLKSDTKVSPPSPLKRPSERAEVMVSGATSQVVTPSSVAYYVQAIIPGRAWIADSNGRIVTVTLGDRFEALNTTVKAIDPINGLVTLSNGRQIEYGMVAQ